MINANETEKCVWMSVKWKDQNSEKRIDMIGLVFRSL